MSRKTSKALTGARAPSPAVRARTVPASNLQSPPQRFALSAISFYQRRLSPGLAPACRFQPTCSHYAYDAVERYGAIRGLVMAAWRILRCNPLNDGGFDPVPERHPTPKGTSPA